MQAVWDAWVAPLADAQMRPAQWVEVLALPALALALSAWLSPDDPALLQAHWPWAWLSAVLVALRYGVLPGLIASALLLAHLAWVTLALQPQAPWPIEPLFGSGLLVLVCGEFSDVWRERNRTMEEVVRYATERLSQLTKRHLLLNLSHDRLEQEMLTRPGTLRDAMVRLRELSQTAPSPAEPLPAAQRLLQLISQYTGMESGALYLLGHASGHWRLGAQVAELGETKPLAPDDPLLELALRENRLAHVARDDLDAKQASSTLIVAPMLAGEDRAMGVLAVERIPFFALNEENLQLMLVMLGYHADCLSTGAQVAALRQRLPSMPTLMAQEWVKLARLQSRFEVPSQVMVMRFEGAQARDMPAEFLRIKRGLDLYWQTFDGATPVVAVLMPLSTYAAVSGFTARLERWLRERFQGTFDSLGVRLRVLSLAEADPVARLQALMQ